MRLLETVSVNAEVITDAQYKGISEKYKKTPDEKLQLRRYSIDKAYGLNRKLNSEFIKKFEDIIPQYYNLVKMNCSNLRFLVEHEANKHIKDTNADTVDRLHDKNHILKLWTAHNIVQTLGFDDIFDKKEIQGYPYDKARTFLVSYHHKISVLFGNNAKIDWGNFDIEETAVKRKIALTLNTFLKNICNVGVKNKGRGRKIIENIFRIKGIDLFEDNNVVIPKNEFAENLINDRLYITKKVVKNNTISYKKVKRTPAELESFDKNNNRLLYRQNIREDDDTVFDLIF